MTAATSIALVPFRINLALPARQRAYDENVIMSFSRIPKSSSRLSFFG